MKHLLLILISTIWSMAATAQEPGIYVNDELREQEVSRETLYQYASAVRMNDVIHVYILPTAEGLEYKPYVPLNKGTWTFHGNGSWISCFDKSKEPLHIYDINVTFDNLSNEGIDGIRPTLFATYSDASVTLTDCRMWDVVFKANQGASTVTFTSGEYWNLHGEQDNGVINTVIAGGTFFECEEFLDQTHATFAPGTIFTDPNSGEPLSIDSSGRIVDADGNPASAFTCCEDTADPVISYTTPTGQSGTFSSVNAAVKYFANTKNDMHVDLTLLADVTANGRLRFDGMHATLNLGTHRIRFDKETGTESAYQVVCFNSAITINADEGGGIDFDYIEPAGMPIINGIAIDKDATLTITSGSYRGHGYMVANFGTVNISGGTFHSIDHGTVYWRDSEANISGGHFITDSKSYAAVYSNGRSLKDGYSYWIHDNGEPLETLDVYNPSYSGYIHNLTTQAMSRNVSVEKQSLQVRVTAEGKDLLFDSVAEALKEAQNYESATVTFVGNGDVIGCRDYAVIERGNITFDIGQTYVYFTSRSISAAITIKGGTVTVKGDDDHGELAAYMTLFHVTGTGTINVESAIYFSDKENALLADEGTHVNISGGGFIIDNTSHCAVDLSSKHANITGGIFYNAYGRYSFYSSEPCMSDDYSFYYLGNTDSEHELTFIPGSALTLPYGDPAHYALVAPSSGPRVTVTAHDGSQTTTQKFYSMEKALAFATEHESAHIDVHQHDYKWGAYRMAKGNVTIDLHGNYINSLYDISYEPEFSDYIQHTVDYGAIVVSGGHLTINADNSNSWNIYSDVGCIVATGTSTIELNGVSTWSYLGIDIVASGRSTITVCGGSHHADYTIQSLTDSRYGSATVAAINEGYISIFDGTFEGLNTLYSDNSGEHDDDDYGSIYGSNISVYGGRFKGLAHRPAVTLHDGLLLCGGRYSCDSGQSAIAYPGERIYESWWNFIGEGYPPRDYYSGERLEMVVDRNDNGRVVFYTDSTQTAYANDIYLSMSPIFQIQHLTHLIDEAKHGRASVSDVQKMVSKVLKK